MKVNCKEYTRGGPSAIAPELAGWTEEKLPSCYWIRRAEGAEEAERAIKIIQWRELG